MAMAMARQGDATRAAATRGGRARPSITIHWDARHLLGDAADGVADVLRRRCVLGEEHVLGRSVAERLLCSADVTEVLTYFGADGTTQPLGVTHHRRRPTPAERAALVARDGGCVFPGCDVPATWADAHHTVPYELGKTDRAARAGAAVSQPPPRRPRGRLPAVAHPRGARARARPRWPPAPRGGAGPQAPPAAVARAATQDRVPGPTTRLASEGTTRPTVRRLAGSRHRSLTVGPRHLAYDRSPWPCTWRSSTR